MTRRTFTVLTAGLMLAAPILSSVPARAQSDWPARPVKLIVPYPPGGPVDQLARTLSPRLSEVLGQSVLIDNKSGASGIIGMDAAIKAEPDGYTFGFGVPGGITVLPHLQKMPYAVEEIVYVSLVARIPQVVAVGPAVPAASLDELIALARRSPGKLNYGSAGNATTPHLGAELLAREAGVQLVHIAYKGAAPAVTALLGGEIQLLVADMPAVIAFGAKGVRFLAVAASQRSEALPDVPTTAELGLPGVVSESNYGIIAARNTPAAITQRMREALITTLGTPAVKAQLGRLGAIATTSTPDEYRQLMQTESAKWGALVRQAKIALQ